MQHLCLFVTYHLMPSPSKTLYLFVLLLLLDQSLIAQAVISPRESLSTVFEKGNLMVALSGVEWRPGLTMAAARLETGATISLNLTLDPSTNYVFIATTANGDASDVDLYLRNSMGQLQAEDKETDGTPVLEFSTTNGGSYQLQIHLAGSNQPSEFVALSILQGGGRSILRQDYEQVANNFFRMASVTRSNFTGTNWLSKPNQWCLFGYSLHQNQGTTLRQLRPGAGDTFFAAAGSPALRNIDLYLADQSLHIIANDIGPGAKPIIRHKTKANANYDLRVEVENSKGNGLLLVGVFQK